MAWKMLKNMLGCDSGAWVFALWEEAFQSSLVLY